MRAVFGVVAFTVLAGCAVSPKDLEKYGEVKLDGTYIKSFGISESGPARESSAGCIATIVRNDSVTLTDAAGSFVGQYSKRYYAMGSSREAGGGGIIQYVSPDESKIVAQGVTKYTSAMITRAVRFTLTVQQSEASRRYQFTGIEQAQTDTGYSPNSGYFRVHTAAGGGSEKVLASLKGVADEIEACVK